MARRSSPMPLGSARLFSTGAQPLRLAPAALVLAMLASPAALGQDTALRSFDRVLPLETTGETSASVSLGDIYGDGHLDIVLAKGRHWPLNNILLRNDGRGHFTSAVLGDAPDRTYTAALADLDGDGRLDIVVSNDRPDRKLIYLNDGKGRFRVGGTFGHPEWSTRYVTIADLNGDKRPDLIVANRSSNPANPTPSFVCLNDGKGEFPSCSPLATESATIIVASDLDGDGHADLFVPHRDGGQSLIVWNDGAGRFTAAPSKIGPEHSSIRAASAADINGDGLPDLIAGDERTGMFVYLGRPHRTFDAPVALGAAGSGPPYAIAVADLNRDGRPDIVVGRQEARGSAFFNLGGGGPPRFREEPWNDGKGSVYGVAIGDLDGDGWPDIAAARSDAPNAVWFNGPAPRLLPLRDVPLGPRLTGAVSVEDTRGWPSRHAVQAYVDAREDYLLFFSGGVKRYTIPLREPFHPGRWWSSGQPARRRVPLWLGGGRRVQARIADFVPEAAWALAARSANNR